MKKIQFVHCDAYQIIWQICLSSLGFTIIGNFHIKIIFNFGNIVSTIVWLTVSVWIVIIIHNLWKFRFKLCIMEDFKDWKIKYLPFIDWFIYHLNWIPESWKYSIGIYLHEKKNEVIETIKLTFSLIETLYQRWVFNVESPVQCSGSSILHWVSNF